MDPGEHKIHLPLIKGVGVGGRRWVRWVVWGPDEGGCMSMVEVEKPRV